MSHDGCMQVGTVDSNDEGQDDAKTLKEIKFQTGDFMDVAIMMPKDREPRREPERERERERERGAPVGGPRGRGAAPRAGGGGGGGRPWR